MPDVVASALLDALETGHAILGADERIQHANPALVALCGRSELVGKSLTEVFGIPISLAESPVIVQAMTPDGVYWDARLSKQVVPGGWLLTAHRGPTAQRLAQATRRIAHDINNHLQVISISAGTLSASAIPGSPAWEDTSEIGDAVQHVHKLLTRLQHMARNVPISTRPEPVQEPTTATIMLVENHPRIAEATGRVLERNGFQPTVLTDPAAAMERFVEPGSNWDAAIISMHLRGLTGMRLATMLRRAQPDLPIILCVAGDLLPSPTALVAAGVVEIVQKPFSHSELLGAVRRVLKISAE